MYTGTDATRHRGNHCAQNADHEKRCDEYTSQFTIKIGTAALDALQLECGNCPNTAWTSLVAKVAISPYRTLESAL